MSTASAGGTCTTGPAITASALTSASGDMWGASTNCSLTFVGLRSRTGTSGWLAPLETAAGGSMQPTIPPAGRSPYPSRLTMPWPTPASTVVNAATSRGPEMTCPVVWSTDDERPIRCCGPGATSSRAAPASRVDHSTVRVPVLRLALRRSVVRGSGGEGADLGEQLRQQRRQGPLDAPHCVHPRSPPRRGLGVRTR